MVVMLLNQRSKFSTVRPQHPFRARIPWYARCLFDNSTANSCCQFAGFPMNLQMLHAYMAQMGGGAGLPFHAPPTTTMQPQLKQTKSSKGIKAYPDGWQQVLNSVKDIVRSSILLKVPFPGPNQARVAVNEAFHEALAIECNNGLVLTPGMFSLSTHLSVLITLLICVK